MPNPKILIRKKLSWSKKGEGGAAVFLLKVKKNSFLTPPLRGRLRSMLGLCSSFRATCRTDGIGLMDGIELGWLSLVVGSLRAPSVLIKKVKEVK